MGPRKRTERMLRELAEDGFRIEEADLSRLYAPAGLDIGANAPTEIALSIIAEMRAVLDGRRGGMLRERRGSIHGRLSDGERVCVNDDTRVSDGELGRINDGERVAVLEAGAHPLAAA